MANQKLKKAKKAKNDEFYTQYSDIQKEMLYFTYDEFKQFLTVENNLKHRVMFEILYYWGLRKG